MQCAGCSFLDVTYVGSLLKERGIHSVKGACLFEWLMWDLCLKNETYTVCRVLVPCVAYVRSLLKERGICSVQGTCSFAWLMLDL